ncbi:MAG: hybrid sensor histidine kinase/response regulator [Candidatus Eisenbacteria bacterium]|nr:hybrid sensor histidine kinase/response regulator [Candidatus Eisenbacteria bacterium]
MDPLRQGTPEIPDEAGPGALEPAPTGAPGLAEAPARVLVVDDEQTVVDVLQEFLASLGYDVSMAASAEAAQRLIPELRPEVVLTDLNLPGRSGLDVMRFAKSVDEETVVIVVTGHASTTSAIDALRQGAYDYITKPFELDDVQKSLERALANRRLRAINRQLVEELRQKNGILQNHEQELKEKVRLATWQMRTLYEMGKEISANLELAPRLQIIAAKAAELAGARAAVVYLRNHETEECRVAAVHGLELPPSEEPCTHFFAAERTLGFPVFEQRPVRRNAADGEPGFELPALGGLSFRQMLALPLATEGLSIGMLVLLDKPGGFTGEDESLLELFASQATIAVQNSQLFEHTKSLDRLKSEFVAVVSHEIRTPLTSVKGAVELLSDHRYFANTDQQHKLLSIAQANAERLLLLINDILDFSKLESASLPMVLERQRLEPVVRQAAQNLRTLIEERRIQLDVDLAEDMPDLLLDANRVAQVLTNLLSNAIKFSPPEGRIELGVRCERETVRVWVRDYGEGIAAEDVPKLFRKFSQIDSGSTRKVGGTGLGLVICKGIVEQHGGTIGVETTPGEGSTFFFTLPTADYAGEHARGADSGRAAASGTAAGERPAA